VARLFAALKLRLLRNGVRRAPGRILALVLALVLGALVGGGGLVALASLRGQGHQATSVGIVVFTMLALGWTVIPPLLFGADETLDPARLALLPLTRRQLMTGLLAASAVGVPAAVTALVLVGALIGLSGGPASVLVGLLAIALELALCLSLSRAVTSALSGLLRSRRGRDLSVVVGALLAVGVQVLNLTFQLLFRSADPDAVLSGLTDRLRWTPPGLAATAIEDGREGRYGAALLALAVVAATVAGLLVWWQRTLARALTTADASSAVRKPSRRRGAAAARGRSVLSGRAGAVAAKELRYAWRDPRRKTAWVSALVVGALVPLASVAGGGGLHRGAVFAVCSMAMFAGLQSFNSIGLDGAATWVNLTTATLPGDLVADLAGKNLAVALVAVPALGVVGLVLAVLSGGWLLLPLALAAAGCLLGVALGVGNVLSVRAPYAVPERPTGAFATTGAGQGCAIGVVALLGTVSVLALMVPPAAVTLGLYAVSGRAALLPVLVLAPAYGAGVCWAGRRLAAGALLERMPEVLAAVSPKRAA
jgi:ABC-2 type transport system permease protein